jgi:ribosomal protein S27AE
MPTKTCLRCGAPFQAKPGRTSYCSGRCFCANEAAGSARRVARYTPERRRAYVLVQSALTHGRLIPRGCEVCGKGYTVAHHDDYAAPLSVRWLCRSHHRQHHVEHGSAKNAFVADQAVA